LGTRLRAWKGQDRVKDLSKGFEMVESLIALALVRGIRAELAFRQLLPEVLGGVEERPIRGNAIPTAQAATGSLFSIICHSSLRKDIDNMEEGTGYRDLLHL
jgi:hypothetical protein